MKKLEKEIRRDIDTMKYSVKWSDAKRAIRENRIYKFQLAVIAVAFAIVALVAFYYVIQSGRLNSQLEGIQVNNEGVIGNGISND